VRANDAAHNEQTKAIAVGFGGEIGLKNSGDIFGSDATTGVTENDAHMVGIQGGRHSQDATTFHSLKGIAADIVKGLLDLVSIDLKQGQALG
jgi:hypothetical protein